ncbi:MAG: arginase family protein [Gemmatimonadota bacterium]
MVERIQPDDGGPCAAAIVGLPFDAAIPTRPGARRGPDAFRTALTRFSADQGSSQWPVGSRITDLGDVDLRNLGVADAHDRVVRVLSGVLDRVDCLIAIGGDQSLSFPVFRALVDARGGSWGLISLDAHHDVRPYSRDSISSGTSMRRALELEALSPKQLIQIGIRPFANSAVVAHFLRW